MSKYFYHGLGEAFQYKNSLDRAFDIFKNGGIQSQIQSDTDMNYISIYKKLPSEEYDRAFRYKHAFSSVVENCFCFIISDEIDAIRPIRIPTCSYSGMEMKRLKEIHKNRRFTEMCDEWQVRDRIPLSSIVGIGIPIRWITLHWKDVGQLEKLGELVTIAEKLCLDIVDTNNPKFVEEYETEKIGENSKIYLVSKKEIEE